MLCAAIASVCLHVIRLFKCLVFGVLLLSDGSSTSTGSGGVVGQVLLANADALCAAATPLVESEDINL